MCAQVTDGGWEDIVDRLMNTLGQLNLPLGLVFNSTVAPNMANWSVRAVLHRGEGRHLINGYLWSPPCVHCSSILPQRTA